MRGVPVKCHASEGCMMQPQPITEGDYAWAEVPKNVMHLATYLRSKCAAK